MHISWFVSLFSMFSFLLSFFFDHFLGTFEEKIRQVKVLGVEGDYYCLIIHTRILFFSVLNI